MPGNEVYSIHSIGLLRRMKLACQIQNSRFQVGAMHFSWLMYIQVVGKATMAYLRDWSAVEGVGLNDICSSIQISVMNLLDDFGSRDDQEIIISFQLILMLCISLTSVVFLLQLISLDHCSHGTINEHDSILHDFFQVFEGVHFLQRIPAYWLRDYHMSNVGRVGGRSRMD